MGTCIGRAALAETDTQVACFSSPTVTPDNSNAAQEFQGGSQSQRESENVMVISPAQGQQLLKGLFSYDLLSNT